MLQLYSPGAQSPEILEHLLVGRAEIADRIVADLAHSIETPAKHHHLLVGPRGIGKTHLVSVVYHRLRALNLPTARIAWLNEDPWGIRSVDKLVDAIAASLATEPAATRTVRSPGETSASLLRRLAGDGTIVLIVENLNSVFGRIRPEGQRTLRAFLQNSGQLVLLATSPTLFAGVTSQDDPFYGSFCTTKLAELALTDAQELVARVARLRGHGPLAEAVLSPRGHRRLKVVHQLVGGNPRVWMLVAECISVESFDDLAPLVLKVLDALTPYYLERMASLGDQQEEIVAYLCTEPGARSVCDIASSLAVDQRTAAAQLGRLVAKGFVRHVTLTGPSHRGDRRLSNYEIGEPLMQLCLDAKQSRGRSVAAAVEFLQDWYDGSDTCALPESIACALAAWNIDHDRQHLLQLPTEQRSVAMELLGLA